MLTVVRWHPMNGHTIPCNIASPCQLKTSHHVKIFLQFVFKLFGIVIDPISEKEENDDIFHIDLSIYTKA